MPDEQRQAKRTVIVNGSFDGVHLGHQALLRRAAKLAQARAAQSVALTFELPPQNYLGRPKRLILPPERKIERLRDYVDRVVVIDFPTVQSLTPAAFARQILHDRLGAIAVVSGEDYRFGHERRGDLSRLRELGAELGFSAHVVPPVLLEGEPVSSTRVRRAIEAGEIALATRLLGDAPRLWGRVERGAGRGRQLGAPTANLAVDPRLVLPEQGIFAAQVYWQQRWWPAAFYVGRRPSFAADGRPAALEVHLLDFEGDLYGRELEVKLLAKIRDDRRFEQVEALVDQMSEDLAKIRGFFQEANEPGH